MTSIPPVDLTPEIDSMWGELMDAVAGVLRSGRFIMGPNVSAFESEAASYLGVRHAVTLNSGTDALVIGLRALGVGPGDEVITTAFSFFATAEAISTVGATPVFCDIDPETCNIDPSSIEDRITSRTRAVIPVHLYGLQADMGPILELAADRRLSVIEDAAQSFGASRGDAKAGTLGDAGAFSFFPTKNLGACGDGGLLVTGRDDVAEMARMLRSHGSKVKYRNELLGYNSRLDEIQAAILRVKLVHVDRWNRERRFAAERYDDLLARAEGLSLPAPGDRHTHVYHQYTVRIQGGHRDRVQSALRDAGIGTMVYYPVPLHRLPVYGLPAGTLPRAEQAAAEVLSLPLWPGMEAGVQERVASALAGCMSAR